MENTGLQLSDLKVSNLPELQGWKEKQETLVKDNPYIEITDNKTYEIACKSRIALLKGRTSLEGQEKTIASKLSAFRKEIGSKTKELIDITLPFEEKQQVEVKRYEGIKEAERLERERVEQERIDNIKSKIESIETESFAIIQKMTFQTVIPDGAAICLICKQEFDFEEYDILFEQTLARIENAIKDKIDDLNEREEQRLENERMKQDIFNVRVIRFKELGFELEDDIMFRSTELPHTYTKSELLNIDSATFERAIENLKQAKEGLKQAKLDAENLEEKNKAKADKDKIFEIRKGRLVESGLEYVENSELGVSGFIYPKSFNIQGYDISDIYDTDAIDFETIITDAKLAIEKDKSDAEESEKKIMSRIAKLLEIGLKYPEEKDGYTIADDCNYFFPIKDYYNASEEEFDNILLEAKQAVADYKSSKEDAEHLKKENKARVKRLVGDKKIISESLEVYFADLHLSTENKESLDFIITANTKIQALKNELLTELEKL